MTQDTPSSRSALGTMRNGLGALTNLRQLLSARHIGPQKIEAVLPDVRQGTSSMLSASETLLARDVSSSVEAGFIKRVVAKTLLDLDGTLQRAASGRRLGAGARLKLERAVDHAEVALSSVMLLFEVLATQVSECRAVDLNELVQQSRSGDAATTPRSEGTTVLLSSEGSARMRSTPRAALALLCLGAAAAHCPSPLELTLTPGLARFCQASHGRAGVGSNSTATLLLPPTTQATGPAFSLAARVFGLEARCDVGSAVILLHAAP